MPELDSLKRVRDPKNDAAYQQYLEKYKSARDRAGDEADGTMKEAKLAGAELG